jgi:hypothetical protein
LLQTSGFRKKSKQSKKWLNTGLTIVKIHQNWLAVAVGWRLKNLSSATPLTLQIIQTRSKEDFVKVGGVEEAFLMKQLWKLQTQEHPLSCQKRGLWLPDGNRACQKVTKERILVQTSMCFSLFKDFEDRLFASLRLSEVRALFWVARVVPQVDTVLPHGSSVTSKKKKFQTWLHKWTARAADTHLCVRVSFVQPICSSNHCVRASK